MEQQFNKAYREASDAFRRSNQSKQSVAQLYDLRYALESSAKSPEEYLLLSNIYSLLQFHQFAHEAFLLAAVPADKKTMAKGYALREKAQTHGNTFAIKDTRIKPKKLPQTRLTVDDFESIADDGQELQLKDKDIVVFNQTLAHDKVSFSVYGKHAAEESIPKFIAYLDWLADCKAPLIAYYNAEMSRYTMEIADDDWYNSLEIYSMRVYIDLQGDPAADIATGDRISMDHLLDIQIRKETIVEMNYDG